MSGLCPLHPLVGVGIVVWRGPRVLLVRRGHPPRQGEWSIPGGRQELGETVYQAAMREALEETGLRVHPREILTVIDAIRRNDTGAVSHHYTLVEVLADAEPGEAVAGDDAEAVCWATLEEALDMVAWEETRRLIRMAADRRGG